LAKVAKSQTTPAQKTVEKPSEEQETEALPTLPENIYPLLPDFLRQITQYANSREDADLLLLGSLVVISACLPNVYGIYGGVTVFPNLFLFVTAQASAGKGRLSLCRRLVEPIHRQLRELNKVELEEYKRQQAEYAANKKKSRCRTATRATLAGALYPCKQQRNHCISDFERQQRHRFDV
jgi:hypothetical protein